MDGGDGTRDGDEAAALTLSLWGADLVMSPHGDDVVLMMMDEDGGR